MPTYVFQCPAGCVFERYVRLSHFHLPQACQAHDYHSERMIQAPLQVKVAQDICYTSPIDERPITNWHAREEDLKRNGCRPYDPGQKDDYSRRIKESEAALDKTVEASVEEAIEKMPTQKRGRLYSELAEQGAAADVIRTTPHV